jgi:hypothetical protein
MRQSCAAGVGVRNLQRHRSDLPSPRMAVLRERGEPVPEPLTQVVVVDVI